MQGPLCIVLIMLQVARVRKPNVKDPEDLRKVEVLASLQLEGRVMVRGLLSCSGPESHRARY